MKIVVAPDKFKGSLAAGQVAAAITAGLRAGLAGRTGVPGAPAAELVSVPVADGGDGTVDAAVAAGFERVPVAVDGPTGAGFAALAVLGAERRPGIELVLDLVDFDAALAGASLVITGEGALDTQTLAGKAPAGVARAAARRGIPVVAVAGRSTLTEPELGSAGIAAVYTLSDLEPDLQRCTADASRLLWQVGHALARDRLVTAVTGS